MKCLFTLRQFIIELERGLVWSAGLGAPHEKLAWAQGCERRGRGGQESD